MIQQLKASYPTNSKLNIKEVLLVLFLLEISNWKMVLIASYFFYMDLKKKSFPLFHQKWLNKYPNFFLFFFKSYLSNLIK